MPPIRYVVITGVLLAAARGIAYRFFGWDGELALDDLPGLLLGAVVIGVLASPLLLLEERRRRNAWRRARVAEQAAWDEKELRFREELSLDLDRAERGGERRAD